MKKNKTLLKLLTACTLALTTCLVNIQVLKTEATTVTNPIPTPKTASQQYAEAMKPGWNLGNSYDAINTNPGAVSDETAWGNPVVTQQLIDTIAAQGFKSIRMPFTAATRIGAAPTYTIDPTFLARYAQTVQWALNDGLYVMINIHHDSWQWAQYYEASDDNGVSVAEYQAIWTQLANYFKNYSSKVCFESLNEPYFVDHNNSNIDPAVQMQRLSDLNTQFVNIVRGTGGNNATRMLVLPTLNTGDNDANCTSVYNTIQALRDPNIMATVHYYGYWPFSVNICGYTSFNDEVAGYVRQSFDHTYTHFVANGIGVVVGEYGLQDSGYDAVEFGEQLKFFEYVNYYAQVDGITLMLWDNGHHMNRTTYTWNDPTLMNMMKTSWTTRSSYTTSDNYFVNYANRNKDLTMNVTLNGNTLSSIYNGNTKLTAGTDYTYLNGVVTLKGSYISRLIKGSYGTKATLTMKFSAGVDWILYLNYYTTPILSSATGTTAGFSIPVQFNGSKLSSLEAVYSNGTGVGPANWTTYKQYNYAFTVDYTGNKVNLTSTFFKNDDGTTINDGTIILTLHFMSGESIQYTINKTGTSVVSK